LSPASKFVDDAAQIGASGRWAALNATIVRLAKNPGSNNAWYVQVLAGPYSNIFSEHLLLKRAHAEEQGDASLLAWRARNLLELSV
jgi:hypothetical protein